MEEEPPSRSSPASHHSCPHLNLPCLCLPRYLSSNWLMLFSEAMLGPGPAVFTERLLSLVPSLPPSSGSGANSQQSPRGPQPWAWKPPPPSWCKHQHSPSALSPPSPSMVTGNHDRAAKSLFASLDMCNIGSMSYSHFAQYLQT